MVQIENTSTVDDEKDKKANATKVMAQWIASFVKNETKPVFPPIAGGREVNPLLQVYAKTLYGPEANNDLLAPLASAVEALARFTAAVKQGASKDELAQLGRDFEASWSVFLHDRQNFVDKYGLPAEQLLQVLDETMDRVFKKDGV